MDFWDTVQRALADARSSRTADELITALNRWQTTSSGDAFFAGSGGDDQLVEALDRTVWQIRRIESDYHWSAVSRIDGSTVEYVEGDVYKRE